jgi:serine/threonine protein kinase
MKNLIKKQSRKTSKKQSRKTSKKQSRKTSKKDSNNLLISFTRNGKGNNIYKYGISEKNLPKELKVEENVILGVGQNGVVLNGFYNKKPVAVKFVILDSYIPTSDCGSISDIRDCLQFKTIEFNKEIKDSLFASKLGISPDILFHKIINLESYETPKNGINGPNKIGIIVMEKINGITLKRYIQENVEIYKKNKTLLIDNYLETASKLAKRNLIHNDAHFDNIMIDPLTLNLYYIDVSFSKTTTSEIDFERILKVWKFEEDRALKKGMFRVRDDNEDDSELEDY